MGSGWAPLRQATAPCSRDPIFARTVFNTVIFLGVGINLKLLLALSALGLLRRHAAVDPLAQHHLHPALGGAVDPDDLLVPLDAELRMGDVQRPALGPVRHRGAVVAGQAGLAFGSVIFVHIWKYLPFWTLILLAGRMAIPTDLYEAARIDGASPSQSSPTSPGRSSRTSTSRALLLSTIWSSATSTASTCSPAAARRS